jgi:hypothetical protein
MNKESECKPTEIENIRKSGSSSCDRIPLLGMSSSEVGSCGIRQWSLFVQILLMELINSFTVGMKFSRLPLRHTITNPLDQVLEFAAVYPAVQDCFDEVLVFAINLNWQWWIGPLTWVWIVWCWFYKRYMMDIVILHCGQQFDSICIW